MARSNGRRIRRVRDVTAHRCRIVCGSIDFLYAFYQLNAAAKATEVGARSPLFPIRSRQGSTTCQTRPCSTASEPGGVLPSFTVTCSDSKCSCAGTCTGIGDRSTRRPWTASCLVKVPHPAARQRSSYAIGMCDILASITPANVVDRLHPNRAWLCGPPGRPGSDHHCLTARYAIPIFLFHRAPGSANCHAADEHNRHGPRPLLSRRQRRLRIVREQGARDDRLSFARHRHEAVGRRDRAATLRFPILSKSASLEKYSNRPQSAAGRELVVARGDLAAAGRSPGIRAARRVCRAARTRDFFVVIGDEISTNDYKRVIRTGGADWVSANADAAEVVEIIAGRRSLQRHDFEPAAAQAAGQSRYRLFRVPGGSATPRWCWKRRCILRSDKKTQEQRYALLILISKPATFATMWTASRD